MYTYGVLKYTAYFGKAKGKAPILELSNSSYCLIFKNLNTEVSEFSSLTSSVFSNYLTKSVSF